MIKQPSSTCGASPAVIGSRTVTSSRFVAPAVARMRK